MLRRQQFAQIPSDVLARFGELTKTEIRVLTYLYLRRYRDGACRMPNREWVRRADIISFTDLDKGKVSIAVRALLASGLVEERDEGYFLPDGVEKVTDSVTESNEEELPIQQPRVTDLVTEVTDSVTKSYQNGNSTYIDSYGHKSHTESNGNWQWPLKPLFETFPHLVDEMVPGQCGEIIAAVQPGDEAAWENTLKLYRRNYNPATGSWRPERTGTLLKTFETEKRNLEKSNANQSPHTAKLPTPEERAAEREVARSQGVRRPEALMSGLLGSRSNHTEPV